MPQIAHGRPYDLLLGRDDTPVHRIDGTDLAKGLPPTHWRPIHPLTLAAPSWGRLEPLVVGPSGIYAVVTVHGPLPAGNVVAEVRDLGDQVAARVPQRYRAMVRPVICGPVPDREADRVSVRRDGVLITDLLTLGQDRKSVV